MPDTPDQSDEAMAARARSELARLEEALREADERLREAQTRWQYAAAGNGCEAAVEERAALEACERMQSAYWHAWATAVRIVIGVAPD